MTDKRLTEAANDGLEKLLFSSDFRKTDELKHTAL